MPATHLEAIGFTSKSKDKLHEWLEQALEDSRPFGVEGGCYYLWAPGSGLELWIQIDETDAIVGFTPFFAGQSRVKIALSERGMKRSGNSLGGGFMGWVDGEIDTSNGSPEAFGLFPLIFEAPDFARHAPIQLPALVETRLTAFVHSARIYPRGQAMTMRAGMPVPLADESFFPQGSMGGQYEPSQPSAFFTGKITRVAPVTNPLTGKVFHWLGIKTYGCEIDAVLAPSRFGPKPQPGDAIYCDACMFGQIIS